ncbi:MAG: hypothetical protein SFV54_26060 [Bryobacteraceae bacterium]|nr:hypothetical protein [Bryobacteraceae bacterium]
MREEQVNAGLRALAADERRLEAPRHVEETVLAAFATRRNNPWPRQSRRQWLAAAASIVIVVALSWLLGREAKPPAAPPVAAGGFMAIPYATGAAPVGGGYIVRVRMERTALVSLGIPAGAAPPGARVQADLLVGDDGVAHAIRLVR